MTVTDELIEWNHKYQTYMRCSIEVTPARRAGGGPRNRGTSIGIRPGGEFEYDDPNYQQEAKEREDFRARRPDD
jgi:hypothetical protein